MSEKIKEQDIAEVQTLELLGTKFNMYGTKDRPLFLAVDVAEMIEYSVDKTHQMLELVDDNEKLTDTIYRKGQKREVWFLTEDGLYELLMQSRKPLAKPFKLEIKKVLHQIRTGKIRITDVKVGKELIIEHARLIRPFSNFSGEASQYNRAGDRNFCVVIDDPSLVDKLIRDGWNVKASKPKDEEYEVEHYIQVSVRFDNFPPKIVLLSGGVMTPLDESEVAQLDLVDYDNIDLTINPSRWDVNGKSGIKAYLGSMYVTLKTDYLANKYSDDYFRAVEDEKDLPL